MKSISQVLNEINNLLNAGILRGTITKQYYSKVSKGKTRKIGPYFVYTVSVKGARTVRRVPKDQVTAYKSAISRCKQVKELFNNLLQQGEIV
jgi:hypothetical protein